MKKIVNIYVGTELPMTSPTHPLSCAMATKKMIDKILEMPESRFEVRTNSETSVKMFQLYGRYKNISIQFYINGKKSSYKAVLEDFGRAEEYIKTVEEEINKKL